MKKNKKTLNPFLNSVIIIYCSTFIISSCSTKSDNETKAEDDKTKDSGLVDSTNEVTVKTNFKIVPGISVGDILPHSTEKELLKIFGKENVTRDSIDVGEGYHVAGTKIFKGTKNELSITWAEGAEYIKPAHLTIDNPLSDWETEQGIRIGTSLSEIQELNGKSFTITGFGWDYAGTILSWNGGKLEKIGGINNEKMILRLGEPEKLGISQEEYLKLLGDDAFDSSNDLLQKMNPEVYQMVFTLND